MFVITCTPLFAPAELVPPGGSITTNGLDAVPSPGEVIATDTRSVTLNYDLGPFEPSTIDPTYSFELDFVTEVRRDPATQRLTFIYRFDDPPGTPGLGVEDGRFVVQSFARFETDVSTGGEWTVTRSADGATLDADSFGHGVASAPSRCRQACGSA